MLFMFAGFMEGFGLKKKGIAIGMLLLFTCLLLAGCGAASTEKKAVAGSDGIKIVTSFYPMYVATINITKGVEGVEVTNMTKPQTGCLHDYQLTTEDMKKLEKANVFVVNGGGMEAFLDKVIKQQKNLQIVDASKDIELLQGDEGPNPHVWVSVSNAIQQVKNITSQLCAIDPTHADAYRANALDYVQRLSNLKNEMHQQLDGGEQLLHAHALAVAAGVLQGACDLDPVLLVTGQLPRCAQSVARQRRGDGINHVMQLGVAAPAQRPISNFSALDDAHRLGLELCERCVVGFLCFALFIALLQVHHLFDLIKARSAIHQGHHHVGR